MAGLLVSMSKIFGGFFNVHSKQNSYYSWEINSLIIITLLVAAVFYTDLSLYKDVKRKLINIQHKYVYSKVNKSTEFCFSF